MVSTCAFFGGVHISSSKLFTLFEFKRHFHYELRNSHMHVNGRPEREWTLAPVSECSSQCKDPSRTIPFLSDIAVILRRYPFSTFFTAFPFLEYFRTIFVKSVAPRPHHGPCLIPRFDCDVVSCSFAAFLLEKVNISPPS